MSASDPAALVFGHKTEPTLLSAPEPTCTTRKPLGAQPVLPHRSGSPGRTTIDAGHGFHLRSTKKRLRQSANPIRSRTVDAGFSTGTETAVRVSHTPLVGRTPFPPGLTLVMPVFPILRCTPAAQLEDLAIANPATVPYSAEAFKTMWLKSRLIHRSVPNAGRIQLSRPVSG